MKNTKKYYRDKKTGMLSYRMRIKMKDGHTGNFVARAASRSELQKVEEQIRFYAQVTGEVPIEWWAPKEMKYQQQLKQAEDAAKAAARGPTVQEVMDTYMNSPNLAATTVRGYNSFYKNWYMDIRDCYAKELTMEKLRKSFENYGDGKALTKKTYGNARSFLSTAFRYSDLILPYIDVKKLVDRKLEEKKKVYLAPEHIQMYINKVLSGGYQQGENQKEKDACMLIMLLSLRMSELDGLTYGDIDLESWTIRIRKTRVYGNEGWTASPGKTENAQREIYVFIPALRRLLTEVCQKHKPEEKLMPVCPCMIREYVKTIVKDIPVTAAVGNYGMPVIVPSEEFHPHSFRHTYASLGFHVCPDMERVIAMQGGWATKSVTKGVMASVYTHVVDKDIAEFRAKMLAWYTEQENAKKKSADA